MKKISKSEIFVIIGLIFFIVLDQLTKVIFARDIMLIEGVLKFSNVQNTGGAFGIFNTSIITVIIMNVIVISMMIRFLILRKSYMRKLVVIALTFMIAGGISNLIDRIFRGYVIDFIDLTQIINFPVFNLADIVLVVGWILLIIGVFKDFKNDIK